MRIVIDTNVPLSGLLWHGTPHALLNQVRVGSVELIMSPTLLDELTKVISRQKFAIILQRTTRTQTHYTYTGTDSERVAHFCRNGGRSALIPACVP